MLYRDGRPLIHRKQTAAEDPRRSFMNPPAASQRTLVKPTSQGLRELIGFNGPPQAKLDQAKNFVGINPKDLTEKLNKLKREREIQGNPDMLVHHAHERLGSRFPAMEEDDGQSILDQHVSRVFSPGNNNSPGTISPKHLNKLHHRSNEMTTSMPEFGKVHNSKLFSCFKFRNNAMIL